MRKSHGVLDQKQCFELWLKYDSIYHVATALAEQGVCNPETGNPFSGSAIWQSAMRYIIQDPDASYQIYVDKGSKLTRKEFNVFLIKHAMTIFRSQRKLEEWVKEHGLQDYEFAWKCKYPHLNG